MKGEKRKKEKTNKFERVQSRRSNAMTRRVGARKGKRDVTCIRGTIVYIYSPIQLDETSLPSLHWFVFVILPFSRSFHLKIPFFFFETKSGGSRFIFVLSPDILPATPSFSLPAQPSPAQPNLLLLCLRCMAPGMRPFQITFLFFFWRIKEKGTKKLPFRE